MALEPTPETPDFSGMYRSEDAPKDLDPGEQLFQAISQANKAQAAPLPAKPASPTKPQSGHPTTGGTALPSKPSTPKPSPAGPSSVNSGTSETAQALLARLQPLGITSLDQLKSKSDIELRKLSSDVLAYENRQSALNQYFYKNPDGSFDMTKGPDGTPTGLDATGKVVSTSQKPATGGGTTGQKPKPVVSSGPKTPSKPLKKTTGTSKTKSKAVVAPKPAPNAVVKAPEPVKTAPKPLVTPKYPVK
jgi:hypothetical protein